MNEAEATRRQLWWLSYCDPKKPTGSQFQGVLILEAKTFLGAVAKAHLLGLDPGGEVQGFAIDPHLCSKVPRHRIGVLLDRKTAEGMDAEVGVN